MIANVIVIILLLIACFFLTVVTIGLFRLPDVLSRLHLSSKCDTLGAISILLALAIYAGWSYNVLRLVAIGFLVIITSVLINDIGMPVMLSNFLHYLIVGFGVAGFIIAISMIAKLSLVR